MLQLYYINEPNGTLQLGSKPIATGSGEGVLRMLNEGQFIYDGEVLTLESANLESKLVKLIDSPYLVASIVKDKTLIKLKGGPGSGDWGHRGRPGLVGGSAEAGGSRYSQGGEDFNTRTTRSLQWLKIRRQAKIETAMQARTQALIDASPKKKKVLKDPPAEFVEEHFNYRPLINRSNEIISSATGGKFQDAAKFIYNAYEFEHEQSGMKARVTDISPANHYISINGEIVDRDNNFIGKFERVIHETGEIHNEYFIVHNDSRGSGFGASFYKNAEETYLEAGIDNVTIYANIDVGGYAWARMGFDFRDDYARQTTYENVVYEFMRDSNMDFADATFELSKYGITNKSKAYDFAAFTNPKTGTRIGKNAMLGTDWYAIKKVDPNDLGWLAGQAYYVSKGL